MTKSAVEEVPLVTLPVLSIVAAVTDAAAQPGRLARIL